MQETVESVEDRVKMVVYRREGDEICVMGQQV